MVGDPALRTLAGWRALFGVLVVMALFRLLVKTVGQGLGLSDRIACSACFRPGAVLVVIVLVAVPSAAA